MIRYIFKCQDCNWEKIIDVKKKSDLELLEAVETAKSFHVANFRHIVRMKQETHWTFR